jgi:DNA polymerase
MVIGEGPGADEDAAGRPFVGAAGQLLDKMLLSIGLDRNRNCYIANIVKCRPPGNRNPLPEEVAACIPFLHRQIAALRPAVILAAGRVSAQALLDTSEGITSMRGHFRTYTHGELSIPLLPTFHPSALLRDPPKKADAFADLKRLMLHLLPLDAASRAAAEPLAEKYAAKDAEFAAEYRNL